MTRRRTLMAATAVLVAPPILRAQPAAKVHRIGLLAINPPAPQSTVWVAFIDELRQRGYVEGQNLLIEGRHASGDTARLDALALELVALRVDAIFTMSGTFGALAAKRATSTIPIVMFTAADPVASGLVTSLARPGGNVTGNSIQGLVLGLKRFEILAEVVGKPARLAYLARASVSTLPTFESYGRDLASGARALGVELLPVRVRADAELAPTFEAMRRDRVDGVVVDNFGFFTLYRTIAELAISHQLATIAEGKAFAEAGGLMAYGVNYDDLARRAAAYLDKIFRGTKAAELPVEQASKFDLILNLKTAKALGLTIPQSLRLRADEVIQ